MTRGENSDFQTRKNQGQVGQRALRVYGNDLDCLLDGARQARDCEGRLDCVVVVEAVLTLLWLKRRVRSIFRP